MVSAGQLRLVELEAFLPSFSKLVEGIFCKVNLQAKFIYLD